MDDNEKPEKLNSLAYIVVREAVCFYQPRTDGPVRIVPPHGSEVEVLEQSEEWVLIKWVGKEAWSPRPHLDNECLWKTNTLPDSTVQRYQAVGASLGSRIEYGPRGGRFTRTSKGYRRYF